MTIGDFILQIGIKDYDTTHAYSIRKTKTTDLTQLCTIKTQKMHFSNKTRAQKLLRLDAFISTPNCKAIVVHQLRR